MSYPNDSKSGPGTRKDDKEPVFRLTINLTESTIVAILTLLVGVGFGVQIGGAGASQPEAEKAAPVVEEVQQL